jgi:4'-phosphopantetheinyl transferase
MRLHADAVHIWRADLDGIGDQPVGLLPESELARAKRIVSNRAQRRWMAARGVLRALLGGYLDEDPVALRFAEEGQGKPVLALHPEAQLHFNLSHSGGLALYAVTEMCEVGVDVERSERPLDELALAERIFGAAEVERLRTLDPQSRRVEFLRAWVRHEAEVKRTGAGIAEDGSHPEGHRQSVGMTPWIAELDAGPGTFAAVALARAPQELSCLEWPAQAL